MGLLKFSEIIDKIDCLEESNILIAALECRVFTHLGTQARTVEYVSRKAKLTFEGCMALLDALCAMNVLIKVKSKYKNSAETYKYLCERSKDYKKGTVFLKKESRDEWSDLVSVIQRRRKEDKGGDNPEFRELFTHAMHERSENYSKKLAKFVALKPVGNLVDVGCGPGSYSSEILKVDKKANALLIDRVASLKVAKKILKNLSTYKRFRFCSGDIFDVHFGTEVDTVLYSNILHIYNDSENLILLNKIHASLKPGGRIIIVDLFLNESRTQPYDAALFSLTMLMFTDTGRTYSFNETERLLAKVGFGKFKRLDLCRGSSVIEAEKI
jgi:ubiquinone/menaquinone biosynthesis C-methylase UbiE